MESAVNFSEPLTFDLQIAFINIVNIANGLFLLILFSIKSNI